jgi:hypothetical protein
MAANYATQAYTTVLGGAPIFVCAGAKKDTVTDATLIATWASNWTATAPVAGVGNITGVLAGYLASYPNGTQVS